MAQSEDTHHAILKLTTRDQSVPVADALKTSIDVLNFGNNLLDIHRLLDAHPGLLKGKAHLNNALKRKRQNDNDESAVALPTTAYSDKRRPRKNVFNELKRMTAESNESRRKCYMCDSTAGFDHVCDDCHSLNSDMKKVTCD